MKRIGWALLAAYIGVIFAANWAITRFGIVPVGFGLLAPAGVYFAGAAYELRDLVQDTLGRRWVLFAILAGGALSYLISAPAIAIASCTAFLLGELADFAIYTPLRRRFWLVAMLIANPIGDLVDSAIFLMIAFHSLNFLTGQVVGKAWLTWVPVGILWLGRKAWRARQTRVAVGIDWMTGNELSQAIPPAYTRFIGESWLASQGTAHPVGSMAARQPHEEEVSGAR